MKKYLLVLTHPDEWNQLLPFNSYINSLKSGYEKVIGVVPYKGHIVLSEADEIITVNDGDYFSYPSILENLNTRRNDEFLNKCVNFCVEKYGSENLDIRSWQNTTYDSGVVDEISKPAVEYYKSSFNYAKKFFDDGLTIKPTESGFNAIEVKYGDIFDENTFIVLTRNFSKKTNVHNTINTLPHLKKTIQHLIEGGLKIVNIGFPPQSYDIDGEYLEINESLSQEELISLFYLSKGVIMAADAGGFVTHYGTNVDFYLLSEEWSVLHPDILISLVAAKKTNKTISLIGLKDEEILKVLKLNGREQDKAFSEPKLINVLK
jgi:hypothetical protein